MENRSSKALTVGERGRSVIRDNYSYKKGTSHSKGRSKSRGQKFSCWHCKNEGYMKKKCFNNTDFLKLKCFYIEKYYK
jgi:hypothetical protein